MTYAKKWFTQWERESRARRNETGKWRSLQKKWSISQGWFEEGLDETVVRTNMHFSLRCASALCLKWKWKWKSLSHIWLFKTPWTPWILQARILEWVAFPFSRGPSQPRNRMGSPALQVDSLPTKLQGNGKLSFWFTRHRAGHSLVA